MEGRGNGVGQFPFLHFSFPTSAPALQYLKPILRQCHCAILNNRQKLCCRAEVSRKQGESPLAKNRQVTQFIDKLALSGQAAIAGPFDQTQMKKDGHREDMR